MRARDFPGGGRGSVVLFWCCRSCAILQGGTPNPHPTTKGLKAQSAPLCSLRCRHLVMSGHHAGGGPSLKQPETTTTANRVTY